MTHTDPIPEPLSSPSGVPLTPWSDWQLRLEHGDTYLLATVTPDARPHLTPVLAVWLNGSLYFTARAATRKARNITQNPRCCMSIGDDTFDLVVEGEASEVTDQVTLQRIAEACTAKYPWWHPTVHDTQFYPDGSDASPSTVYAMPPTTAFGFGKEKGFSASRWRF